MTVSAPIVSFGAGNLGRRIARAIHPVLICDNNRSLWDSAIDGIPVASPEVAVKRYPDATFVVAIWHPSRTERMTDRINQLRALRASNAVSYTHLDVYKRQGPRTGSYLIWSADSVPDNRF